MTHKDLIIRMQNLLQNPVLKERDIIFQSTIPKKTEPSGFMDSYVTVWSNDDYTMMNIHEDGSFYLNSSSNTCDYAMFVEEYRLFLLDNELHIECGEKPIITIPQSEIHSIDPDMLFQLGTSYSNFEEYYEAYLYCTDNLIDAFMETAVLEIVCNDFEKALLEKGG